MKRAFVALAVVSALFHAYGAGAGDCLKLPPPPQSRLYSYTQKNGSVPELFSVAGLGNRDYLLDPHTHLVVSPTQLAKQIKASPAFKTAARVVLIWPYSASGANSYAQRLGLLLHVPVLGFEGPVWWYPDGVAIGSDPAGGVAAPAREADVASCITSDGQYHPAKECKPLLAAHPADKALFNNLTFMLTCGDMKALKELTQGVNNAGANMALFLYYAFVENDANRAAPYLAKAKLSGTVYSQSFGQPDEEPKAAH